MNLNEARRTFRLGIEDTKSRIMQWVRHAAHVEERRNSYKILVRKSDGKKPVGRIRYELVG
jgi:hypothetical protein